MRHTILVLFLSCLSPPFLFAQTPNPPPPDGNLATDRPRRFSLVFNRGLMLTSNMQDTVPFNGSSSGTFFVGGGIRIPIYKDIVGIRLTPGLAWTHLNYQQSADKVFPTVNADSGAIDFTLEQHGLAFAELPLGVFVNLSRDEDGDTRFFLEAGGYIGYLLAANYKVKYDQNGLRIKEKTRDLQTLNEKEFERLRYGLYGRVGYKWVSLYYSYRLTEVFDPFTNADRRPKPVEGFRNPNVPRMEFGLTIFL